MIMKTTLYILILLFLAAFGAGCKTEPIEFEDVVPPSDEPYCDPVVSRVTLIPLVPTPL